MPEAGRVQVGWTTVAFGDVVRQVKDQVDPKESGLERYVAGNHMDTDDLRIRRWGKIGDDYLGPAFHMRFKPGHVLYGSRRTYLRKVSHADFEGITANTTYVLESTNPDVLLPKLLPFVMQTEPFHAHSKRESRGSVNPYVNFSDLASYEFALPPLPVQRRIVEVLLACERTTNGMQELIKATETTYLAIIGDFFSCALGPEPADGIYFSSSGARWEWRRVDEMFSLQLGKMSSKKAREGEEQAKYIKNNNVLWGGFSLDDLPSMSFNERERGKFSLETGDLLVCEGGEIGRAAIWPGDRQDIYYQKALHRLRPISPDANTWFFMHYLRACSRNGILNRISTGGTIPHLPRVRLAELRLPFPDLSEQRLCLEILGSLQDSLRDATRRSDQLKSFKGILLVEALML